MKVDNRIFQICITVFAVGLASALDGVPETNQALLAAIANKIQSPNSLEMAPHDQIQQNAVNQNLAAKAVAQTLLQKNQELYKEALKQTAIKALEKKAVKSNTKTHAKRKKRKLSDKIVLDLRQEANHMYQKELEIALKEFKKKQKEVHESFENTYSKLLKKTEKKNYKVLVGYLSSYAKQMEKERGKVREKFQHLTELVDASYAPFKHKKYKWKDIEKRFRIPGANDDHGIDKNEDIDDYFEPKVINASPPDLAKPRK